MLEDVKDMRFEMTDAGGVENMKVEDVDDAGGVENGS